MVAVSYKVIITNYQKSECDRLHGNGWDWQKLVCVHSKIFVDGQIQVLVFGGDWSPLLEQVESVTPGDSIVESRGEEELVYARRAFIVAVLDRTKANLEKAILVISISWISGASVNSQNGSICGTPGWKRILGDICTWRQSILDFGGQ